MTDMFRQQTILVVEDDYLLALETTQALTMAGARVIGPVPTGDAAILKLDQDPPDAAIIDLNTGKGISLDLAAALKTRSIPFVILTGYDDWVIPRVYSDVPRFQKPADLKMLLARLRELQHAASPKDFGQDA